ncbi:MAG: DUF4159 domain-containing protein [Pirellulales bacterium]
MRRFQGIAGAVCLLVVSIAPVAKAEVTAEDVRRAIEDASSFLLSHQNKVDGSWGDPPGQPGGLTALVTLALLSGGEDPRSEPIQKALRHLESIGNPKLTYATSLQTMAFCAADPQRFQLRIVENVRWLESTQIASGPSQGSWAYSGRQGTGDNSNAQFALLGLYEAERVGVKVDPKVWRAAIEYWSRSQAADGSWGYTPGESPSGSMTCAGIASLVIASGQLQSGDSAVAGDQVKCCQGDQGDDVARRIELGLQWLGQHFRVNANPSGVGAVGLNRTYHYYYLYGVERVGRLTGRRYFMGQRTVDGRKTPQPRDWYREGAQELIERKDPIQRCWIGVGVTESNPVLATAFALLYLSKGKRPIVISQLRHPDDDWNSHERGVPNLTRRVEQRWKRDLTWQNVDVRASTVADLQQTPVLFISGRGPLELTADQKQNLKGYVAQGGFLFVEACHGQGCQGEAFDASFRALLDELFPDSKLRLLPPDHPVWYAESRVNPKHLRPLYGLDTCCRTSIVYCPQTLSCYWELCPFERDVNYSPAVLEEIESVARIGENVVTYATNRELKDKLDRPLIQLASLPRDVRRGALQIPKLSHGGGADEAVNALPNLLALFSKQTQLPSEPAARLLPISDEQLYDYPIVFMHGRRAFRLSNAERTALAEYLRRGGFLFADSICANPQFADSFRAELRAMFPEAKLTRIPASHPMFTNEFRGFDLAQVSLRDPQARGDGDPLVARLVKSQPFLEALEIEGRWAVIFSPYDISCALENHASLDCKGYVPADAGKIAVNVLLFALQQ